MSRFVISNVVLEEFDDGVLMANFDVKRINENGDQVATSREADWIDLNDGLLVAYGDDSNMYHWSPEFSHEEREEIHGEVNDYLSEHPISEEFLQRYRDAREAKDVEILDHQHALSM